MLDFKKIYNIIISGILLILLILPILFITNKKNSHNTNKNSDKVRVTKEMALKTVSELPEVKEFLENTPTGGINVIDSDPYQGNWQVQVYETKNGHTATFNWYYVNEGTGKITKEFEFFPEESSQFSCPTNGWVDCMPGPDKDMTKCSEEAQKWYKTNCSNYQGIAY